MCLKVASLVDCSLIVDVVLLDFLKGFDIVSHVFLQKFRDFTVPGMLLNLT